MARRKQTIALFLMGIALMLACAPPKNMIRLGPSSSADSLVFLLRTIADTSQAAESVYGLSVIRCDTRETAWQIAADGSRQIAATVVYGKPVPGFPTRFGPMPLRPGCYEIIVSGAKTQRFEVGPQRMIRIRDTVVVP
jgi:hypothetical protein